MRMGEDKGRIGYYGKPQAAHLHELVLQCCERAFVSVGARHADSDSFLSLPLIRDEQFGQGPASALLAAARHDPKAAWLVVAVDLVLLDAATIAALVAGRNAAAAATAFRHADGTIEPLCAIWEPAACAALGERVAAGDASPRRCLESLGVEILACPRPEALRSIDSPADRDAVRRQLLRGR